MFRRTLIGGVAILMLIGSARLADAQVSVNIGINLPGPPRLVAVPATPVVMYAPSVGANYFFTETATTYLRMTAGSSVRGTTVRGQSSRRSSCRGRS